MHPPKDASRSGSSNWKRVNPSRERCIELAIELTSVLCQYHREHLTKPLAEQVFPTMFSYFLFDGAVALAGALSQVPPHSRATECLDLINNAMSCLRNIAETSQDPVDSEGDTASRALKVLAALRRAGGWDLGEEDFRNRSRVLILRTGYTSSNGSRNTAIDQTIRDVAYA